MASERGLPAIVVPLVPRNHATRATVVFDHGTMTKPDVNVLIAITTAAGFCLCARADSLPLSWLGAPPHGRGNGARSKRTTVIGAVPGAMPPLIGWAAARGRLDAEAWMPFGIVFLWHFPHFMAIAWMYRADYDRAGYRVLPAGEARAPFVTHQTLLAIVALVPVSLLPLVAGYASPLYGLGALIFGSPSSTARPGSRYGPVPRPRASSWWRPSSTCRWSSRGSYFPICDPSRGDPKPPCAPRGEDSASRQSGSCLRLPRKVS
jgi:hypothetical protein